MTEQSSEKSGIDGKIGRLTAIVVALTALIGALFALISTFGEGYSKAFHASAPPTGVVPVSSPPAKTSDASTGRPPGACLIGFVWREAVAGDHVCVTPDTRRSAALDNRDALGHVSATDHSSGPGTCAQGYVWREATSADHSCVTVQTREQTQADNRAAGSRVAGP